MTARPTFSKRMLMPSFRFGPQLEHELQLKPGYLGGERYFVNGELALHLWRPRWSGVREFTTHGHRVQIHVKVDRKKTDVRAFVDGVLVNDEVYAELNAWLRSRKEEREAEARKPLLRRFGAWLMKVAVWFVLSLTVFTAMRQCQPARSPDRAQPTGQSEHPGIVRASTPGP